MKRNDVYKFVLKPGVPGKEIDNLASQVETSGGFLNVKYPARENRCASLYAVFRVNQAPDFAKTTAMYTVIEEKEDLPSLFWDDDLGEWVYDPHPPEESTS